MNVNLIVERGKVWDFEELPNKSIALDGAVMGPKIDNYNKKYSFDHHGNCIRHSTSATCVQVLDALLLGFDPTGFNLYINDVDEDTVVATALILKPELSLNENVQDIVRAMGLIDAHGNAYPLKKALRRQIDILMHKVMQGFYKSKNEKITSNKHLKELFLECINGFYMMLDGKYKNIEINFPTVDYLIEPVTNSDWYMVHSHSHVFSEMYKLGYNKVVLWFEMRDGSISYTIGKKSEFIDFPVKEILENLNKIEKGWGGGSTIGGAPRHFDGSRSKLPPEKIMEVINYTILHQAQ